MTGSDNPPTKVRGIGRIADAVTTWAKQSGARTAVRAADGEFTFAQLADQTRALAGRLAAEGVGPQTPVGLFLGRSRFGLPSLLAVWWLGATAVLVDDRHPPDRINAILRDAGAQILVADRVPAGAAPSRARTIRPDAGNVADSAGDTGPVAAPADSCAYIVYTSGTTGWPKGVEVTYRNLETFLDALAGLDLPSGGMGVNLVSPAFDGWLWCALLYLLHGQGMAVVDLAARDTSAGLSELVEAHSPRTVCLTPTLLSALERVPAAECVVVAGEPCPPKLVARLADVPRVLNVYGPTEATIAATWADNARGDDLTTIGRPLPGYHAYILDEEGAPVPAGTDGELHLGGPAVARGYRNRPELTLERFPADRFAGDGSRMYRTGDVVRARPDGQIEFRGRADEQVKVRGFRVELGEIEQVAMAVDGVSAAAAYTSAAGDSVGLAVSTAPGVEPVECVARIRERCKTLLPDYMTPAAVQVVATLPTLPTGKVDRTALALAAGPQAGGRPPATEREQQVCETWSGLLARPVTDVEANFFELGGHSLLAARAVGSLRRSSGLPLSVHHLLAEPTAAALAREMDALALGPDAPVRTDGDGR